MRQYNFKSAFLGVMLFRAGENIVITVYRKVTNADVYFNWNSFAPQSWKGGILRTQTQTYIICSTTELLDTELKHLEKVFVDKNKCPKWVIRQAFAQVKFINESNLSPSTIETIEVPANENKVVTRKHMLLLPYQGDKGIDLPNLPNMFLGSKIHVIKTQFTFTGQKLSTQFNVKDMTKFKHKHDLICFGKFSKTIVLITILVNLLGESERIIDHGG